MNKKILLAILPVLLMTTAVMADTIVSDATTEWSADGLTNWQATYATYVHPSWPSISGATWIWRTALTDPAYEYANVPAGGWYFRKTFTIPECTDKNTIVGTLYSDADNSESAYINGNFLYQDGSLDKSGPDGYEWQTVKQSDLTPYLQIGTNTLLFRAMNYFNTGDGYGNPAGLIFKADVTYTDTGDSDGDGVCNPVDICPGTIADIPDVSLGVNRHIWEGGDYFTTLVPGAKGAKIEVQSPFSITDTYGCSCEQILDEIKDASGAQMVGHWKYGCSKSVMEEWILDMSDEVFDGMYYVETVTVPANKATNTLSVESLMAGQEYLLKAYGTANAGDNIEFDAKYSFRTGSSSTWTDAVSTYEIYGTNLLDLYVNGVNVDWSTYNSAHTYWLPVTGTGSTLSFNIYDIYYSNNVGNLNVDIYAKL